MRLVLFVNESRTSIGCGFFMPGVLGGARPLSWSATFAIRHDLDPTRWAEFS
jgi:hypothetical protein